jgi:hydrogenase/urease accessory protein HupE
MPGATLRLLLAVLLWAVAFNAMASAHEGETSYLRARVQPGMIEVRVTFDALTLEKIVRGIDANADDALSKAELAAATGAIRQFIEAHFELELDGTAAPLGTAREPFWPLDAPDSLPRATWHDQGALLLFPFDLPVSHAPAKVRLSFGGFATVGERHRVFAVLEESAGSQPVILSAGRSTHLFTTRAAAHPSAADTPTSVSEQPSSAAQFFGEGVKHILEGYDHIAFLLALLLATTRLRQVALIVTAFTVAHSITLILAARGVVQLPSRGIECAIAATIVYVGVENLTRAEPSYRWALTFVFGLIHGFGFANVLGKLALPADQLVTSLLFFNLGIELGQLAIVGVLWPVLHALGSSGWGRRVRFGFNIVIGLLGLAWLLDRALQLEWMPF